MKLVPTEHIPGRCAKHDLQKLIEEFMNGEAKVVNVDFNEHDYKSSKSCAGCFHNAIRRSGYSVKVCRRGDKVFLYKMCFFKKDRALNKGSFFLRKIYILYCERRK